MDREDEFSQPPRPAGEGIRIIGAEEAAAALETGQAEGRRPSDEPRFGDVPAAPTGPRPAIRFPLEPDEADELTNPVGVGGTRFEPPAAEGEPPVVTVPEMPHWTEPPTGEVPRILGGSEPPEPDEAASWSSFTRAPRWRDQGGDWDEAEFGDASVLADEETRIGALDMSRSEHSDLFSFDEPLSEEPSQQPPTRIRTRSPGGESEEVPPRRASRDNGVAIMVGSGLGLLFLLLASAGPKFLIILVAAIVALCATEVFAVLRRAGYRPATLLGLVATISLMVGAYVKGERALPLVVVLTLVFSMLWYLSGVMLGRPTVNIAVTMMGFLWAGLLGSYAALILRPRAYADHRAGVALLLGCVLCVVANDVGGYAVGRTFGRTPIAPNVSPNKTLEGYLGGLALTILVGAGLVGHIHPFSIAKGFWLAVTIAVIAPLGDLSESMVKRDIGLKDMGTLLPGHGGVFDRFDAMLFALPATYYLAQVVHFAR